MARSGKVLIGPGRPYDLILVCIVVAVAAILPVYYPASPPAWVLGFLAVFFCPGYAMVSALFPGQFEIIPRTFLPHGERTFTITMLERSALAIGLSATAVALATTIMTRGLLDLTALSVGVLLIALTFIASAVAASRRSKLMPGDQFAIVLPTAERRPFNRAEAGVAAVIIALVMMARGGGKQCAAGRHRRHTGTRAFGGGRRGRPARPPPFGAGARAAGPDHGVRGQPTWGGARTTL